MTTMSDNIDSFMKEYHGKTWPNPINPRERGMTLRDSSLKDGEGYVIMQIRVFDGAIHISSILSSESNKGMGGFVMKILCNLADKHGVKMTLAPQRFGTRKGDMSTPMLKKWYTKLGFKTARGTDEMVRQPISDTKTNAAYDTALAGAEQHPYNHRAVEEASMRPIADILDAAADRVRSDVRQQRNRNRLFEQSSL